MTIKRKVKFMGIASSVASKVINLFFIMLVGVFLRKKKILDKKTTSVMSALLINITNPFLIIYSFQKEYTPELVKNGFTVLFWTVIMHLVLALLGFLAYRFEKDTQRRRMFNFATCFGNCGFLGQPVLMALCGSLGDENGFLYGVFIAFFFNIFCWTYGFILMNNKKGVDVKFLLRKIVTNPCLISAIVGFSLFMLRIRLPFFIAEGVEYIGNMTFPLSMLIVGSLLCELRPDELLKDKTVYWLIAVKLIIAPLVMIFIMKLLSVPLLFAYITVTICAMPSANYAAIMADYYGGDTRLATKCVSISTIASVLTIPLVIFIATSIL